MADNKGFKSGVGCFAAAILVVASAVSAYGAVLPQIEQKCLSKMGKSATKVAQTVMKETAACRDRDISGKSVGACPSAANLAKIGKAVAKTASSAAKTCRSFCSLSQDVECIDDGFCPPLAGGAAAELCTQGAKGKPFRMTDIGFPGPFCEAALGSPISTATEIGQCVAALAEQPGDDLISVVYGSIVNSSAISKDAAGCLRSISKATQKLALSVAKSVAKCRDSINRGKLLGVPAKRCQFADAKSAAKIAKAEAKLTSTVAAKCNPSDILELDLCANGVGGTTSIAAAQSCLVAAAKEVGDGAEVLAPDRVYANRSIIDGAYPPEPVCGDNVANQLPNVFLLIGEECDGTDDAACGTGNCLPPGDAFECTCDNIPRLRLIASGAATDSDAGWSGISIDQTVGDRSGWVTTLSGCDCTEFTGATCTGVSVDSECDVAGFQTPFCSWDTTHSIECDVFGNGNGINRDEDCRICGDFTTNPGASCNSQSDCGSQCYDATGTPTSLCSSQGDCAAGEVCRGQCRQDVQCIKIPDGAPFPISAAGAAVCSTTTFRSDIVGTFDIVTGAHSLSLSSFAKQFLGTLLKPCPVCGGFCVGGTLDGGICEGRCVDSGGGGSLAVCRFDSECAVGEICGSASPDCPGGLCQLELVCGTLAGTNNAVANQACEIFAEDPVFGTMSPTCTPAEVNNITGEGFPVDYQPAATTGQITVNYTIPCTASGFELYDCPCPGGSGKPTQTNSCAPACDAGVNFGQGCATAGASGSATTCVGGINMGRNCDEDADCPGSSCSANPTHCEGDPGFDLQPCTVDADCGLGNCVDACPGGRCIPLCVAEPGDPEDGVCAAGPNVPHCAGSRFSFLSCADSDAVSGTCSATCSGSGAPCSSLNDCPSGETCNGPCSSHTGCEAGNNGILGDVDDHIGAGACISDPVRKCIRNPIVVEGGTTVNGKGSPDDVLQVGFWCFSGTANAGVNEAGFPGPGVIRRRGTHIISVGSIP